MFYILNKEFVVKECDKKKWLLKVGIGFVVGVIIGGVGVGIIVGVVGFVIGVVVG